MRVPSLSLSGQIILTVHFMEQLRTLQLCVDRFSYIPHELYLLLLELLCYPHQYPFIERRLYNKCLGELPTLCIMPGIRIVYNKTRYISRRDGSGKIGIPCKFIYKLHHARDGAYLTIHEHIVAHPPPGCSLRSVVHVSPHLLDSADHRGYSLLPFRSSSDGDDWLLFIKNMMRVYMRRITEANGWNGMGGSLFLNASVVSDIPSKLM